MKVFFDNEPVSVEPQTLRRALEIARERAQQAGRIVVDIVGDGIPITGEILDDPPDNDAGLGELRMVSAAVGPFVRVTLLDAADALLEAKADQDLAAELVQTGNIEDAMGPMQRAISVWDAVQQIVEQTKELAGLEPEAVLIELDGVSFEGRECIGELAKHLGEIKRSLTEQDWSSLSDELAYELDRLGLRWAAMLRALADTVDPK